MSEFQEMDQRLTEDRPKPRRQLRGSLTAKVTAFILLLLMALTVVCGCLGVALMFESGIYTRGEAACRSEIFEDIAWSDASRLHELVAEGRTEAAVAYCVERNIAKVWLKDESGDLNWQWVSGKKASGQWSFSVGNAWSGYQTRPYSAEIVLSEELSEQDTYALADTVVELAYALRYWIYAILAAAALLCLICFIFLLCAAGHHEGEAGVRPGWGTKIPFDLLTLICVLGIIGSAWLSMEGFRYMGSVAVVLQIILLAACGLAALAVFVGWCMSLALRVKLGILFKKTVVYGAMTLLWRLLRWFFRRLKQLLQAGGGGIKSLLSGIPLVWKTVLGFSALSLIELICLCACQWISTFFVLWLIEKMILFGLVLYLALTLRKLQKGGEALASGDLSYQVDTKKMVGDFRKHGEALNSIAMGMTRAVDQRMKSERMKTELITNVSHDLKTPLTSIINYADLISREPCENGRISEYSGSLLRQSERLKKLIEDLVEASKASTGNLEVLLAPCEVGVLLAQAAGEYAQRLETAKLELVIRQPEHPVTVMADGRRLWRVFDNLLNNACKYAQGGTRVYLTLEEQDGQAVISFKNTSRCQLNISAEDLMERFVRGDASRNTEGNGLGLSIARSLTELQKGSLELFVDGDLFKVILRFPMVS